MAGSVAPFPYHQFFDNNGDPLNGGFLYTYAAGTTTPITTWSDAAQTSANANPIVLDSAGRAKIFLASGTSYKFILQTSAAVVVWTIDNVSSVPSSAANTDITGTAGENITAGDAVVISDGTGGRTAGRWYRGDSDDVNTSTLPVLAGFAPSAITSGAPGSIRLGGEITGLAGLTPGLLYYIASTSGGLTSTAPTNARPIAVANSSTSILIFQPTQLAGSGVAAGLVTASAQTLSGIKTFAVPPLYFPGTQSSNSAQITGTIYVNAQPVTTTGVGAEILETFTFPANTFDANGKGFHVKCWGRYLGNNNNKRFQLQWNGTSIVDQTFGATSNAKTFGVEASVIRQAATNFTSMAVMRLSGQAVNNTGTAGQNFYESEFDTIVADSTLARELKVTVTDSTLLGGTTILGFHITML